MHLIGINGFKRSGKGSAATIVDELRLGVKQVGFADKLKILAAKTLGYLDLSDQECIDLMDVMKEDAVLDISRTFVGTLRSDFESVTIKDSTVTVRAVLQNLGNEARGIFGDTFWIDQVLPASGWLGPTLVGDSLRHPMYADAGYLCITDLRYPNEAERVKAYGGTIWELLRPDTGSDGHASEQPLPRHLVDYQIRNDSSLEQLAWNVERTLEDMGC